MNRPVHDGHDVPVAHVTRSTYKRLAGFFIHSTDGISIDHIFSTLYEENLRPVISNHDARHLYVRKMMIEKRFDELAALPKRFSKTYVFSVGSPRFHKDDECKYLKSDFKNYLIPPEIHALGDEKIRQFQEFCQANRKELEEKTDDIFWLRVGAEFKITINPTKITYANSGVRDIKKMSVDDLRSMVVEALGEAQCLLQDPAAGQTVKNLRYAPRVELAISKINNHEIARVVSQFFDLKRKLMDTLFDLYKVQSHSEGYIFPVHLLMSAGIEPCRACFRST